MNSLLQYFKVSARGSLLGCILVLLLLLEILTGGVSALYEKPLSSQPEIFLKISEIESPTIDGGAATISLEEELCLTAEPFPGEVWFLVLLVMGILLAGNFVWALSTKQKMEWVPEAIYVILAFVLWWVLDACHTTVWFPVALLKISLLIFALYLYLFEKKNKESC